MSVDEMAAAGAALQESEAGFPGTLKETPDLSATQVYVLGVPMTPSRTAGLEPDMPSYLAAVEPFTTACRALFPREDGFLERSLAAFESLAGGRPVSVFCGPTGGLYTPATIRIVPPGCEIGTHSGLEFMTLDGYSELANGLDCSEQLSFFSLIDSADDGGELLVYHTDYFDPDLTRDESAKALSDVIDEGSDYEVIALEPGDLLIFAGGRWFHRVTPVRGSRTRRSIGGFLGFSPDGGSVYYWS